MIFLASVIWFAGREKIGASTVNSGDVANNTWPRSADYRKRGVEMTVDDGGRE